jgi:hypothetical protein
MSGPVFCCSEVKGPQDLYSEILYFENWGKSKRVGDQIPRFSDDPTAVASLRHKPFAISVADTTSPRRREAIYVPNVGDGWSGGFSKIMWKQLEDAGFKEVML